MANTHLYRDIAARTGGDIYIGVVGPVRTGKSTFIKQFMETMVLPHITDAGRRERATDELPQSAAGRTIMTAEPKFIPEDAVEIELPEAVRLRLRMIDCVGYIVPSAIGYIEDQTPRMVKTPWYDEEIPFNMAAEVGTRKVIAEHSTIGLVVTTDGSISDIPRSEYEEAEQRVIEELQALGKPFVVLLNCRAPETPQAQALAETLTARYGVPILPVNCLQLTQAEIVRILSQVLFEFPIREIRLQMPGWIAGLDRSHWLRSSVYGTAAALARDLRHVRDVQTFGAQLAESDYVTACSTQRMDLSDGSAVLAVTLAPALFFRVLQEETGVEAADEQALMTQMKTLAAAQKQYRRLRDALDEVEATGYGIVLPDIDELTLEEPEIVRQGGRYGVRLRASAPSLHIMRAQIQTEVAPIVGSESQSEELIRYLLKEFEENPAEIWKSNIFGTSLHELVNEGLHNKLYRMPADARQKLQETLERIINEGCSGLICIIL